MIMTNDKIQMTNEIQMSNEKNKTGKYDLEDRTLIFAKNCIELCKLAGKYEMRTELIGQLIRSSSSIGANYREANDSLTKKEFYHRIGICRKEAKESKYWLELLQYADERFDNKISLAIDEALQLSRIFAAISNKK